MQREVYKATNLLLIGEKEGLEIGLAVILPVCTGCVGCMVTY